MTYDQASRNPGFAFKKDPLAFWRRQHAFKYQMLQSSPNAVHDAVAQLVHHYMSTRRSSHRSASVITQNVDGFDWASSLGVEIFEIHGNLDYMRCSKPCSSNLYPSRLGDVSELNEVPTCPKCGALC